jgi:phosphoenolpyruvate phosphomutase
MKKKIVYVAMAGDIIHPGHINILKIAKKKGFVIVGLLTDNAVRSYKGKTFMLFEDRKKVLMSIKYVDKVIAQKKLDYTDNLTKLKPNFVIHGKDWRTGVQASTRLKVIKTLRAWSGILIEPNYTKKISSTKIRKKYYESKKH